MHAAIKGPCDVRHLSHDKGTTYFPKVITPGVHVDRRDSFDGLRFAVCGGLTNNHVSVLTELTQDSEPAQRPFHFAQMAK